MTDEQIIKALGNCNRNGSCFKCPYDRVRFEAEQDCASEMTADALALINRQRAEIERLENSLAISKKETKRYVANCETIKAEAVKEFAERLKSKHRRILDYDEAGFSAPTDIVYVETIDNLVKEFTEGDGT